MWMRPFSSSDRTYLHTACLRLYPLAEFFFRDDNAAAHTQGGKARFVHQFVGAGYVVVKVQHYLSGWSFYIDK